MALSQAASDGWNPSAGSARSSAAGTELDARNGDSHLQDLPHEKKKKAVLGHDPSMAYFHSNQPRVPNRVTSARHGAAAAGEPGTRAAPTGRQGRSFRGNPHQGLVIAERLLCFRETKKSSFRLWAASGTCGFGRNVAALQGGGTSAPAVDASAGSSSHRVTIAAG